MFVPVEDLNNTLVSSVISIDIEGVRDGSRLADNITVAFRVDLNPNATYTCAYWSFSRRMWLTDGVFLDQASSTKTQIHCLARHLTNFAVLINLDGGAQDSQLSAANQVALEVITYIGCGLSIFCLVITAVTFLVLKVCSFLMHLGLILSGIELSPRLSLFTCRVCSLQLSSSS